MQLKSIRLTTLYLFVIACCLLSACDSKKDIVEKPKEALVRPVKLIEVSQTNKNEFLNYPAVIKSKLLTSLYFEVGGMLNELPVIQAQKVKKGDVLAKLDQRDLLAKVAAAKAQYKNANAEYQRGLRLLKEDAIARSKVEDRRSKRDVAKSEVETAEKALEDSVLIAPYDGNIAKVSVKERQVVQAGSSVIDILGNGGLEAVINLPSSLIVKSGSGRAATDSYVILDTSPDQKIPVTFKEAALEADAASQTYEVTFMFESPENLIILPGMNAVVWFKDPHSSAKSSKVRIPLTAIATDGEQKYVWVVDQKTMLVSKRNIVVETNVGTTIGITSGLVSGETIVAAGVSVLSEGMKVSKWSK